MRLIDPIFDTLFVIKLNHLFDSAAEPVPESWEGAYFFVSVTREIVDQNDSFTSVPFPASDVIVITSASERNEVTHRVPGLKPFPALLHPLAIHDEPRLQINQLKPHHTLKRFRIFKPFGQLNLIEPHFLKRARLRLLALSVQIFHGLIKGSLVEPR